MRNYCLSTEEIVQILRWQENCNTFDDDSSFAAEIQESSCWDSKITCITLLLSRILEQGEKTSVVKKDIIEKIYTMDQILYFEIQEGDYRFIEFLLSHLRNPEQSLENDLITLQNNLSEYNYANSLRY